MSRNTEIDPNTFPPKLREVYEESMSLCVEKNFMRITPDVMTIVLLEKKSIRNLMMENSVNVDKLRDSIAVQLRHNSPTKSVTATMENISFTRDTAVIMTEIVLMNKFDTKDDIQYIDILRTINDFEGTILNEVLKVSVPEISETIFKTKSDNHTKTNEELEELIEEFTTNYTQMAAEGLIDPVIGRDMEIKEISEVLARKKKNNVILLGEAGVGKTAVIEGLALGIVNKEVPESLTDKEVFAIEVSSLLAGTKYRGEFEERARNILKALAEKGNAIVFIDEAHSVMSAGASTTGGVDLANIMKPMLARGELTCIAATTHEEYRKTIQKDSAMVRRFQNYIIHEPTDAHVVEIITKLQPVYEKFHNVEYDVDIAKYALEYGNRFLQNKRNPDKAIDILDAAGAYTKVSERKSVTMEDVMYVVARMANIPTSAMAEREGNVLSNIEERIGKVLFNQDHIIKGIVDELVVAKSGLKEDNKPLGAFLLSGSSGTGKTFLCRELANQLEIPMVKFDMSEYQEKHSVSKLIGSPPGYAGYDENSAKLIDVVNEKPNCLLLLDEVEKAHPQVLSILLQVMDDATVTSSQGKVAKFNNVVIVMTSNLGAQAANTKTTGFIQKEGGSGEIKKAVEKFFAPEFINRLSAMYHFNQLDNGVMVKIVGKEIDILNAKLADKNVVVTLSDEVVEKLAVDGYDPAMGARPLQRLISDSIKRPLSRELVMGSLMHGGNVEVVLKDNEYDFLITDLIAE